MVSSYAQSGKLFEERRAANVRNIPTGTTQCGATFLKDTITLQHRPSRGSSCGPMLPMLGERRAASDSEADWLNRVTPSAQRLSPHPTVVETPFDDIPMSQLTDDNTSQNSGSQSYNVGGRMLNQQPLYSAASRQGVQQIGRFQQRATPNRPPVTSRFGHLTTPRHHQNLSVACTPRANISVASSTMSYRPRSQIKTARRPWSEARTQPSLTPGVSTRSSLQQKKDARSVLLSQSSAATSGFTPRQDAQDHSGRFSFSRAPLVGTSSDIQSNSHASRSSIAAFQVSSDKIMQEQIKRLEEQATSFQDMLAAARDSTLEEINDLKATAVTDLVAVSKDQANQIGKQALEVRENNEKAMKDSFEIHQSQLIDRCLPILQGKASTILTSLIQGPSILKMIERLFKGNKATIKSEAPETLLPDKSTSNKSAIVKKTKNKKFEIQKTSTKIITAKAKSKPIASKVPSDKLAGPKKAKSKPIEPKAAALPRRSKRNAAKISQPKIVDQSNVEGDAISLVSVCKKAKKRKILESVTPASVLQTRKITQPILQPTPVGRCSLADNRGSSVAVEWATPKMNKKKRKRHFGRVLTDADSVGSPESYFVSSRKKLKSENSRISRAAPNARVKAAGRPSMNPIGRAKIGLRTRRKTNAKRSLVTTTAGDCFDFCV